MKRVLLGTAAIVAAGMLPGCLPVVAVPMLQAGMAIGADAFCSPAAAELRGDIREGLYGDREASVLGDDCR